MAERARHQAGRSQQVEPQAALQLRQEILQATTPHRERLLPAQGLPTSRNPLPQVGPKLPCLRMPRRCYRIVDFMSLGPSYRPARLSCSLGMCVVHRELQSMANICGHSRTDGDKPNRPDECCSRPMGMLSVQLSTESDDWRVHPGTVFCFWRLRLRRLPGPPAVHCAHALNRFIDHSPSRGLAAVLGLLRIRIPKVGLL